MFPTFYRILMKLLAPEFREWDAINANSNDTAQKGAESEYELYRKQITIEVAKHQGLEFIQFLFEDSFRTSKWREETR